MGPYRVPVSGSYAAEPRYSDRWGACDPFCIGYAGTMSGPDGRIDETVRLSTHFPISPTKSLLASTTSGQPPGGRMMSTLGRSR